MASIQMVPLSTFAILLNFKGITVSLLSHFWLKEKLNRVSILLIIMGFVGMVLVVKPSLILSRLDLQEESHVQKGTFMGVLK